MAKNKNKNRDIKKIGNHKVMSFVTLFFIILTGIFLYTPIKLITSTEYMPAKFVGCDGKVIKRIGKSRVRYPYAPKAMTTSGETAVGSLALSKRSWCQNIIGNSTHIFVDKTNPKNNRISSFLQFWMFPIILIFITALLLARNSKNARYPISLIFIGIVLYMLNDEFGFITSQKQTEGWDASAPALTECMNQTLKKNKLKTITEITHLSCQINGITDLSSLSQLENLEKLYLQGNQLTSLVTMPLLNKLRVISVANNKKLVSLKGIQNLPILKELQANSSAINDLSGVENLKELRVVSLMYNNISDVSAFASLTKIEDITFYRNSILNIEAFSDKPELKDFSVSHNRVEDISALFENKKMKIVNVRGKGKIPCSQIRELRHRLSSDAKVWGQDKCN